ncbi:MAG: HNH endonuclease [Aeromonas sp.]
MEYKADLTNAHEWRPLPLNNMYWISHDGRIWSCRTNRLLKGTITQWGTQHVTLYHQKRAYSSTVHRLVMNVWGPKPQGEEDNIRHLDGNLLNNNVTNLAWYSKKAHTGKAWDD